MRIFKACNVHSKASREHQAHLPLERSGGPTKQMLEKCFKFDDADKDGSFYLAEKPTSDLKKIYTEKVAFILVKGNFTITDEDEE